jgi:hypothetical protein
MTEPLKFKVVLLENPATNIEPLRIRVVRPENPITNIVTSKIKVIGPETPCHGARGGCPASAWGDPETGLAGGCGGRCGAAGYRVR